jgi:hypothetical protein
MQSAGIGHNQGWQRPKPPPVDTVLGRNRRRLRQHFLAGVHAYGANELGNLVRSHAAKLGQGTRSAWPLDPYTNGKRPASASESVSAGHGPSVVRPVRQSPVSVPRLGPNGPGGAGSVILRGLEDIRWAANDRGVAALPGRPDQW